MGASGAADLGPLAARKKGERAPPQPGRNRHGNASATGTGNAQATEKPVTLGRTGRAPKSGGAQSTGAETVLAGILNAGAVEAY